MRLATLVLLATIALAACTSDSTSTPTATSTASTTPEASATATATASTEPTATPPATVSPTPATATRPVTGLFTEPRNMEVDRTGSLAPIPDSPFEPWNGNDVVLYDTTTMTETNLGPGWVGYGAAFSPDGNSFVWTAGTPNNLSEIWILDLATGERQLLTSGVALWWFDDHTLYGRQRFGDNTNERFDMRTGEWSDATNIDPNLLPGSQFSSVGRWTLQAIDSSEYPGWRTAYQLTDDTGAHLPLKFDATEAVLAPDGTLFVATVPTDAHNPLPNGGPHIEAGTTNIFQVDPETGSATYIASAEASAPGWPFDASKDYVAWMDGFCADAAAGHTVIYNRESGELTSIDALLWFKLTPNGELASGFIGAHQLIDIQTLEYIVVLPKNAGDVSWSPDYRYAAIGFQFGHGGPCG